MKLAVIATNGQAKAIVEEAVKRGHEVTAIVRSENKVQASLLLKDLFELTKDDLTGFDAVISAFGAYTPDTLPLHNKSIELLISFLLFRHFSSCREQKSLYRWNKNDTTFRYVWFSWRI